MLDKLKSLLSALVSRGGDAPKPAGEPLELSFSKISAYRFCPWKYKLLYVDGLRVPPNPYISLGLSVHKTLEMFHQKPNGTLDDLIEAYNEAWVNEGFQNAQQTVHFYEKGKKMLEQYFDFSQSRKTEIVAVEKEFRFPVGKRILRGIIDRIDRWPDGSYEVIDYKTHSEMWDQARIDSDLQLTLYGLGCKKVLNIQPAAYSYFFLAHNKSVPTRRNESHENAALSEFDEVAAKIEAGEFPANPASCPRCDFRNSCQYSSAKRAIPNGQKR